MSVYSKIVLTAIACFAFSAHSQTIAQENEGAKVDKCFITIKSAQKDLLVDASEIKSLNLHKIDDKAVGWRAWKNIGNYPVISIIWKEAGSKKVFFNNNEEAQIAYGSAVNGFQKCKNIKVY